MQTGWGLASAEVAPPGAEPDLCVALDGALVATDLMWECLAAVARRAPWLLLLVPLWVCFGRARLKRKLARKAHLDCTLLPYRQDVVDHVRTARRRGGRVILATAADRRLAEPVARHLGLFDAVLASDGKHDLKGHRKWSAYARLAGPHGFECVADSAADLPLLSLARRAWLVAPGSRLVRQAKGACTLAGVFSAPPWRLGAFVRLLRPHQWCKNALLFAPLPMSHQLFPEGMILGAAVAFAMFSLSASAAYVFNDLVDLEADRRQPLKRHRPLASGAVPIPLAVAVMGLLLAGSLAGAAMLLPPAFTLLLGLYAVITTAYSLYFKRKPAIDIIVLAGLYAFRVVAGGVALGVAVSEWLLAFCLFLFLSLALLKRSQELRLMLDHQQARVHRRGYRADDLPLIENLGAASGCLAMVVFCLLLGNAPAARLYPNPWALWLIAPVLLYWLTRTWLSARRGAVCADPVAFILRDPVSYLTAAAGALLFALASCSWAFW
jgi:4-hydroxybenzoate polyprenyltransferase